jgi:hypothetical protein
MIATPKVEPTTRSESWSARVWRLSWLTVVAATFIASAGWWFLAPGGFRISHPRFWANTAAPIVGMGLSVSALAAFRVGASPVLRWLLSVWPPALMGTAVAGRMLFPITLSRLWLVPLAGAFIMGVSLWPLWRTAGRRSRIGSLVLDLCMASTAAGLVWTQCPPPARTRPSDRNPVALTEKPESSGTPDTGILRLGSETTIHSV